jgi:hypothetical protein
LLALRRLGSRLPLQELLLLVLGLQALEGGSLDDVFVDGSLDHEKLDKHPENERVAHVLERSLSDSGLVLVQLLGSDFEVLKLSH